MTNPTYTVAAGNLTGHDEGDTVTAADLPGANVAALVASGHLKPKKAAPAENKGKS